MWLGSAVPGEARECGVREASGGKMHRDPGPGYAWLKPREGSHSNLGLPWGALEEDR